MLPKALVLIGCLFFVSSLQADTIEMVNGDKVSGEVVGMDAKELHLKSAVFGIIKVPRTKVAAIYFGSKTPRPTGLNTPAARGTTGSRSSQPSSRTPIANPLGRESVADAVRNSGVNPNSLPAAAKARSNNIQQNKNPNAAMPNKAAANNAAANKNGVAGNQPAANVQPPRGPVNVIDQLQTQGVGEGTRKQLEAMFPLMMMPGVSQYFDKTVGGLSNGNIDLLQVRKDAIRARTELVKLKKDLGPAGAALDSYITILDKFIDETVNLGPNNQPKTVNGANNNKQPKKAP